MFHGTSNELSSGCWAGFSNIPEERHSSFSTLGSWAAEVEEEERRIADSEISIPIPAERRIDLPGIPGHFFDFHRDANHGSGILRFTKSNVEHVDDPFSERVSAIQTVILNSTRAIYKNVIYVFDAVTLDAIDVEFRNSNVQTNEIFFMPNISPDSYNESHSDPVIGAQLYGMEMSRIEDDRSFIRYIKAITPSSPDQEDLTMEKLNDSLQELGRVDCTPVLDILSQQTLAVLNLFERPSNIKALIIASFMIRGINNVDSIYPMGYRLLMHSFFDLFSKFLWGDSPYEDYTTVSNFIEWVMIGSCDTCHLRDLLMPEGDYAVFPYSTSSYNIGSRCLSFEGFPKALLHFLPHGTPIPKSNQMRASHTTHAMWFPDMTIPYGKFSFSQDPQNQRLFDVPVGPAFNLYQAHRRLWASYKKSLVTKDSNEFSKVIHSYYMDDELLEAYVDMMSQLISAIKWAHPAMRWVRNLVAIFYLGYIPSAFNILQPINTQYSEFRIDSIGQLRSHLTSTSRREYIAALLPPDHALEDN